MPAVIDSRGKLRRAAAVRRCATPRSLSGMRERTTGSPCGPVAVAARQIESQVDPFNTGTHPASLRSRGDLMSEARWQHGTKIHANFCGFATFRTTISSGSRVLSHPRHLGAIVRSPITVSDQLSDQFCQLTPLLEPSPGTRASSAPDDESPLAEHIGSFCCCYCSFLARDYLCRQLDKDLHSNSCLCASLLYVVFLRP